MQYPFLIILESVPGTESALFVPPFDVAAAFGSRGLIPVRGTLNGVPFQSSLAPRGEGRHYMVVNRALREAAGVRAGDQVRVVLERDTAPRVVEVPLDLAVALEASPAAFAAWARLSYTHRKEHVEAIEAAKKPETRARRIEKTVALLASDRKRH